MDNLRTLIVTALAAGLGLAALGRTLPSPDLHVPALAALPQGATLVVVARPALLRAKGLWKLPTSSEPAKQLARIASTCGFDPLEGVDEIAVATPGSARDGAFGVVVSGSFFAAPREACAQRLARDRDKVLERGFGGPDRRFVVLTDTSGDGRATLALTDGMLLAGDAAYVAEMMRTLASADGSAAVDPTHAGLRRDIAEGAALAVSLRLTADTRETIRRELHDPKAPASNIVGLFASLRTSPRIGLRGVVACEDEGSAAAMTEVLERMAKDAEGSLTARFLGLVPLLRSRVVKAEGRGAVIAAETDPAAASLLIGAIGGVLSP